MSANPTSDPIKFLLDRLAQETEQIPHAALPDLLGQLEAIQARLWVRMLSGTPSKDAHKSLPPEDRLLTPEEAASIMGTPLKWVYRNSRKLPFTRKLSRKCLRFSELGLRRWMEAKRP